MLVVKDKCDNSLLKECFFEQVADSVDKYKCKICCAAGASNNTYQCKPNAGYTNLINHLKGKHKDCWETVFTDWKRKRAGIANDDTGAIMDAFMVQLYSKKTKNVYGWLEWLVDSRTVLPFMFVEDPQFRKHSKLESICRATLKKYACRRAGDFMVESIKEILPPTFGIIFDGWSAPGTHEHYVALYATFIMKDNSATKMKILLAMSPMNETADQTAAAHKQYIKDMLEYYDRTLADVEFLSGDNCNTNGATAALVGCPLVGCAAHRLNLAIKTYFEQGALQLPVEKVEALMTKLSTTKMTALLRHNAASNCRVAKKRQVTRWQGTTSMIKRYLQLAPHFSAMGLPLEILPLVPTLQEHMILAEAIDHVKEFGAAFDMLQKKNHYNLSEVRVMFDSLIEIVLALSPYLRKNADIVQNPEWNGVVKVQNGNENELSAQEKSALRNFKIILEEPGTDTRSVATPTAAVVALWGLQQCQAF